MVSIEYINQVAVVKLDNGTTNPINMKLVLSLQENLEKLKVDDEIRSIVLSSNNAKFFSIGFDLPLLIQLNRDELQNFYEAFNVLSEELYCFPKPTVAALTGHTIAGGCLLALSCDYRHFAAGNKLMGLNEIKLGLPVPYLGDRILHQIAGTKVAKEIMETGELFPPEKMLFWGLCDEVMSPDLIIPGSIEKAEDLAKLPPRALREIKTNRIFPIIEDLNNHKNSKEEIFLDCWFLPETQKLLKEALKKF